MREVAMYQKVGQLTPSHRRWFPEMFNADTEGVPFPWVALSFEGASLHDWLSAKGVRSRVGAAFRLAATDRNPDLALPGWLASYVFLPHRPPELWRMTGDLCSLQCFGPSCRSVVFWLRPV